MYSVTIDSFGGFMHAPRKNDCHGERMGNLFSMDDRENRDA